MSEVPRCGIWVDGRGRLVAAVVGADLRRYAVPSPPRHDEERWDWLARLQQEHGPDVELVLPVTVARNDSLGRYALAGGMPLWLAPERLVEAISNAAFSSPRASTVSSILARLPDVSAWRAHLRRPASLNEPRQLILL